MSGVELFGVLEFGVEVDDGLVVLVGFVDVVSVLLELVLLLCAIAIPVEKITAVAIVRSFLLMRSVLLSAD